ncbi:MAG: nicotinate (nicotinamide) nucleotide adenylyltransferase [Phycisphaerae bacterium]|nr:nicotinate (nicotinamide) nucleotide adenylyltransferase [Phycisphaerae bacterium]
MPSNDQANLRLLFGGTFDPPHLAHVELPLAAVDAMNAREVIFMPAHVNPLKQACPPSSNEHRLEMLELAIAGRGLATIRTDELEREGPSYTVDTIRLLKQEYGDDPLRLLIGSDNAIHLDQWKDVAQVLELAEPVVMLRHPHNREGFATAVDGVAGHDRDWWSRRVLQLPMMDIAGTWIRGLVGQGKQPASLVHPAVAEYIQKHHLYR